jgi:hypothetical protein
MALSQANSENVFNNIFNVKKETSPEPDKEREKRKKKEKKKGKRKGKRKKKRKKKTTVIIKFEFIELPVFKSRETLLNARSFIIKKRKTELELL